jgi:hypothetical protein
MFKEVASMLVGLGIGFVIYLVIIALVIVFLVWFIKTLNEIKRSLLRIDMKLNGYDPGTGAPVGDGNYPGRIE